MSGEKLNSKRLADALTTQFDGVLASIPALAKPKPKTGMFRASCGAHREGRDCPECGPFSRPDFIIWAQSMQYGIHGQSARFRNRTEADVACGLAQRVGYSAVSIEDPENPGQWLVNCPPMPATPSAETTPGSTIAFVDWLIRQGYRQFLDGALPTSSPTVAESVMREANSAGYKTIVVPAPRNGSGWTWLVRPIRTQERTFLRWGALNNMASRDNGIHWADRAHAEQTARAAIAAGYDVDVFSYSSTLYPWIVREVAPGWSAAAIPEANRTLWPLTTVTNPTTTSFAAWATQQGYIMDGDAVPWPAEGGARNFARSAVQHGYNVEVVPYTGEDTRWNFVVQAVATPVSAPETPVPTPVISDEEQRELARQRAELRADRLNRITNEMVRGVNPNPTPAISWRDWCTRRGHSVFGGGESGMPSHLAFVSNDAAHQCREAAVNAGYRDTRMFHNTRLQRWLVVETYADLLQVHEVDVRHQAEMDRIATEREQQRAVDAQSRPLAVDIETTESELSDAPRQIPEVPSEDAGAAEQSAGLRRPDVTDFAGVARANVEMGNIPLRTQEEENAPLDAQPAPIVDPNAPTPKDEA